MKKAGALLLVIIMLIVSGLYLFSRTKEELGMLTAEFAAMANVGDPRAAGYLDADFENGPALLDALAAPSLSLAAATAEPQFQSLTRAEVMFVLQFADGGTRQIAAAVVRGADGWKILSFPSLQLVQTALVTSTVGDEASFMDGQGDTVTLFGDMLPAVGDIGSLLGVDGHIAYFTAYQPLTLGKLLAVKDDSWEGEENGIIPVLGDITLFRRLGDGFHVAGTDELIAGMRDLFLYYDNGRLVAAVLPQEFVPDRIRVLLNTTGFESLSHDDVRVSGNTPLMLEDKVGGQDFRVTAGQSLRFTPSGDGINVLFPTGETAHFSNRLHITPEGGGRIQVDTLRRGSPQFTPAYRGHLEVAPAGGRLQLLNEVSLETYLYSVVPSEMPVSFGLTPLKVQAVAARSYAVASILRSGFRSMGAHVDDSVSSQVYNNVPEYDISTRAVNETSGLVVSFNGEIADTRFFSTSSGVTANFAETWHDPLTGAFPAPAIPYLVTRPQLFAGNIPDVSTEDGARAFFASENWEGYDTLSPWFRWEVEMTRGELEAVLARYLPERQKAQPDFVLTQEGERFVKNEIQANPIGELQDLRVIQRGAGGNIMELEIVGTNGTYRLVKEYTIRFTLRPVRVNGDRDISLRRHDGSQLQNYAILPSSYMVLDINRDSGGRLTGVRFRGGGNGHGVGLSQWGTRGLAERGRPFEEILAHYYPGTSLEAMY